MKIGKVGKRDRNEEIVRKFVNLKKISELPLDQGKRRGKSLIIKISTNLLKFETNIVENH